MSNSEPTITRLGMSGCSATFESQGWQQWNQETWKVEPYEVKYAGHSRASATLNGVAYLDAKGRFKMPPLNPYLPIHFRPMVGSSTAKAASQWIEVATVFAADLRSKGIAGTICLPPGIVDARPFVWAGLEVSIRYTFTTALPFDDSNLDRSLRKRTQKARRLGYTCSRSDNWQAVLRCLRMAERANNFEHRLDVMSLRRAADLVGEDLFRGYVVRDRSGTALSGGIRLGGSASLVHDWVQGADRSALQDGVNQLMYTSVLEDLTGAGALGFDYGGANLPNVANAKSKWGFPLTPYLSLRSRDTRNLGRTIAMTLAQMYGADAMGRIQRRLPKSLRAFSMGLTP